MNTNPSSPGPRSAAGKEISSRNATRHGCCSLDTLILPTENIEDFKAIEAAWLDSYRPQDESSAHLIHQLITADWLYQRSVRTLAEIEAQIFAEQPNPLKWDDAHHKAMARFQRYRTANQNAFNKCRKAVDDHYKTRINEYRQNERLNMARTRLKVYEEKNKPEPSMEELLKSLTEQGIRERAAREAAAPPAE